MSTNDAVEKLPENILTVKFGGSETPPHALIVDPGGFCEGDICQRSLEYFLIGFFYSVNVPHERPSVSEVRRLLLQARTPCGG